MQPDAVHLGPLSESAYFNQSGTACIRSQEQSFHLFGSREMDESYGAGGGVSERSNRRRRAGSSPSSSPPAERRSTSRHRRPRRRWPGARAVSARAAVDRSRDRRAGAPSSR